MELFESDLRITMGATTLLDFGDWLQGLLQITPQREVQVEGYIAAAGIKTFDRANRSHQLTFTAIRDHGTVEAAKAYQLNHTIALPTGGVTTVIQVSNHTGSTSLAYSTLMAAPSDSFERFSRFSYTILGGALTGSLVPTVSAFSIADEAGGVITDEAGAALVDEAG